jgi:hypothetical protein
VRRRDFITLLGGAAAWPLAARGQQPERLRRVGMLIGYAEEDREVRARVSAFEQALKELGWTSGRNIQFTYRWERGKAERMRVYAAELMGLAPDVVLTATTSALAALRRETLTVPIVFVNVHRSDRQRLCGEPGKAWWQYYRVQQFRALDGWQVGPAAQRDCTTGYADRTYQQPGHRPSDQILLFFNRGRGHVAFNEADCDARTR